MANKKKPEQLPAPVAPPVVILEEDATFEREKMGEELFGKELHPYSPSRKIAAQAMGMKYPFTGVTDDFGSYPGMLVDAIIACWLRTLPDATEGEGWTPRKATRKPAQAFDAAEEWAVTNGITSITHKAIAVFVSTMNAIGAADFSLDTDDNGAPKSSLEEGGSGPLV